MDRLGVYERGGHLRARVYLYVDVDREREREIGRRVGGLSRS